MSRKGEDDLTELVGALESHRKKEGITQEVFARVYLGGKVTPSQWSRISRGKSEPNRTTQGAMKDALALIEGEDPAAAEYRRGLAAALKVLEEATARVRAMVSELSSPGGAGGPPGGPDAEQAHRTPGPDDPGGGPNDGEGEDEDDPRRNRAEGEE